jgi:hypothetical protein
MDQAYGDHSNEMYADSYNQPSTERGERGTFCPKSTQNEPDLIP